MPEEYISLDDLDEYKATEEEANLPSVCTIQESSIIQCGRLMCRKARENSNLLTSGQGLLDNSSDYGEISQEQIEYVTLLSNGMSHDKACIYLGIDRFLPMLWRETSEKDGVYIQCLNLLKSAEADRLEAEVWHEAIKNQKSTILKMFALKARKDEYKDNAAPAVATQTNIQVTISDANGNVKPFLVNTELSEGIV